MEKCDYVMVKERIIVPEAVAVKEQIVVPDTVTDVCSMLSDRLFTKDRDEHGRILQTL